MRGFTLLEVVVATAVLALGAVLIYEAFFLSLDIYDYCQNYLSLASFVDEKMWEAQNQPGVLPTGASFSDHGEFIQNKKTFAWDLSRKNAGVGSLTEISLVIQWTEGHRKVKLFRDTYALYKEPQ